MPLWRSRSSNNNRRSSSSNNSDLIIWTSEDWKEQLLLKDKTIYLECVTSNRVCFRTLADLLLPAQVSGFKSHGLNMSQQLQQQIFTARKMQFSFFETMLNEFIRFCCSSATVATLQLYWRLLRQTSQLLHCSIIVHTDKKRIKNCNNSYSKDEGGATDCVNCLYHFKISSTSSSLWHSVRLSCRVRVLNVQQVLSQKQRLEIIRFFH